jgi:hypothetical protein
MSRVRANSAGHGAEADAMPASKSFGDLTDTVSRMSSIPAKEESGPSRERQKTFPLEARAVSDAARQSSEEEHMWDNR